MNSFRKTFGLFALAGVLAVTGASMFAAKTAVLPVEHDRALIVEHDRKAVIVEHESRSATIVEHESRSALFVEHDRSNA